MHERPASEISRDEVRQRLQDPSLVLLNVLPEPTFADGHIPGSRNLPVADIPRRASAVLPDKEQEVAVYCGGFT